MTVVLDSSALSKILLEDMRGPIEEVAAKIASRINLGSVVEANIVVKITATKNMRMNRIRASVTIAHPAGLSMQAKHGTLTRAASGLGLKVKARAR